MMELFKAYEDRKSNNINQRILNIVNIEKNELGEINRMVVTMERNDNNEVEREGTPLNAETFNTIINMLIEEAKSEAM